MKRRLALTLATVLLVVILCGFIVTLRSQAPRVEPQPDASSSQAGTAAPPRMTTASQAPLAPSASCSGPSNFSAAAADNAATLPTATVTPFGRPETGWEIYAPLIAQEVGSSCEPQSPAFAAAVARWQTAHAEVADGKVRPETLSAMTILWLTRRPFVQAMRLGCPAAADPATLEIAHSEESFGGKAIHARPAALDAFRKMVEAARRDLDVRPPILTLASAYRGPEEEAQRCAEGGCGTASKARCSAHRTGLAFDIYLGAAPGADAFSSADANRLFQTRTPAYRWLVAHAAQFGFEPYPFEPWHWEWTGQPV